MRTFACRFFLHNLYIWLTFSRCLRAKCVLFFLLTMLCFWGSFTNYQVCKLLREWNKSRRNKLQMLVALYRFGSQNWMMKIVVMLSNFTQLCFRKSKHFWEKEYKHFTGERIFSIQSFFCVYLTSASQISISCKMKATNRIVSPKIPQFDFKSNRNQIVHRHHGV